MYVYDDTMEKNTEGAYEVLTRERREGNKRKITKTTKWYVCCCHTGIDSIQTPYMIYKLLIKYISMIIFLKEPGDRPTPHFLCTEPASDHSGPSRSGTRPSSLGLGHFAYASSDQTAFLSDRCPVVQARNLSS